MVYACGGRRYPAGSHCCLLFEQRWYYFRTGRQVWPPTGVLFLFLVVQTQHLLVVLRPRHLKMSSTLGLVETSQGNGKQQTDSLARTAMAVIDAAPFSSGLQRTCRIRPHHSSPLLCVAQTPARPKLTSTLTTRDGSFVFIWYPHHIPYSPQKVTKLKVALLAR